MAARRHTHTGCEEPVEEQWKTCRRSQKKRGVVFIWWRRAEEGGTCWLVVTARSFKSFRTVLDGAPFLFRLFFCLQASSRCEHLSLSRFAFAFSFFGLRDILAKRCIFCC